MDSENKHLKGYEYYIQAQIILKHSPTLSMTDVYRIIATIHNVTPESVRKALTRYIRKFSDDSPARLLKKF